MPDLALPSSVSSHPVLLNRPSPLMAHRSSALVFSPSRSAMDLLSLCHSVLPTEDSDFDFDSDVEHLNSGFDADDEDSENEFLTPMGTSTRPNKRSRP